MDVNVLEEFKKCKEDPIFFMCNYIKVTHPVRGLVPFKLYPFQEKIVSELENNRFNILRKFRQAGCTTIASAYALWLAVFQRHQSIVILSKGDTEATEVLDRIKIMYEELPGFLQPGITEDNKHTLKLKNRSVIKSRPSGKQSGRSLAGSFLIIDEAAFVESIDTIWAAVYPIISTGGRAFVLSTVNGLGNWFYETYARAVEKANSFNAIDIRWREHPEYFRCSGFEELYEAMEKRVPPVNVDDWEKVTKSNMPRKQWLQEYECEFLGTGDTFLDGSLLSTLSEEVNEEYYIKYNNRMRVWKDPEPHYDYIIGVDTALGRDRDYSAAQIVNLYNGEVVAEFYSNKTPVNEFASILNKEGIYYNIANIVVERNTVGNHVIDLLFNDLEYENLWHDERGMAGFQVTMRNRDIILTELEESIRTNMLKINSQRTLNELNTFVISNSGKLTADKGRHDDLIMSLSLANHVFRTTRESSLVEFSRDTAFKDDKALKNKTKFPVITPGGPKIEDLTWLMK
tara:strand:- start:4341 stop:5882 length:1542 start_codon:yes stop_codon:yes gene_type:complete